MDHSNRAEFIEAVPYKKWYEGIDFRQHPELYKIGRGEQGVLMAQPYKSEIVPHWRFRTPEIAQASSKKIEEMFHAYLEQEDFPGADMARKYLMMGWTRARRYANHPSGRKYKKGTREVLPLAEDNQESDKAESARIFKMIYDRARHHGKYLQLRKRHKALLKE